MRQLWDRGVSKTRLGHRVSESRLLACVKHRLLRARRIVFLGAAGDYLITLIEGCCELCRKRAVPEAMPTEGQVQVRVVWSPKHVL